MHMSQMNAHRDDQLTEGPAGRRVLLRSSDLEVVIDGSHQIDGKDVVAIQLELLQEPGVVNVRLKLFAKRPLDPAVYGAAILHDMRDCGR
jgi:hypothetical protein